MMNLLYSNVLFSVMALFYLLFLRKLTFHHMNRFYLVFALLFSAAIPYVPLTFPAGTFGGEFTVALPAVSIFPKVTNDMAAVNLLFAVYIAGVAVFLTFFLYRIAKLYMLWQGSARQSVAGNKTSVLNGTFSFFTWVHISDNVPINVREMVVRHENIHKQQWHSLDILIFSIARIMWWFNPLSYLSSREVQLVHEYIADDVSHKNFGPQYQYALLNETFGAAAFPLTNSFFNHSIVKNRVIMMNKKKTSKKFLVIYALAVPVLVAGLWLNSCKEMAPIEETSVETAHEEGKTTEKQTMESSPQFPGGQVSLYEYLATNLVYPKSLKESGIKGKCVVEFTVNADGSLGGIQVLQSDHEQLEGPALEVFRKMPNWEPGTKDGKTVEVKMQLPVVFALS